jgi:type IV secretory pathway VirB4 component
MWVRQGSVLSLILFNVVMNEICLKMKEKTGDLKALVYADDVMIWGNNIKDLEDKVNEWNKICKEFGLNSHDKNL